MCYTTQTLRSRYSDYCGKAGLCSPAHQAKDATLAPRLLQCTRKLRRSSQTLLACFVYRIERVQATLQAHQVSRPVLRRKTLRGEPEMLNLFVTRRDTAYFEVEISTHSHVAKPLSRRDANAPEVEVPTHLAVQTIPYSPFFFRLTSPRHASNFAGLCCTRDNDRQNLAKIYEISVSGHGCQAV